MLPKRLQAGDTVGLICPAGPAEEIWIQNACRGLKAQGLHTLLAPALFHNGWGYAACAEERAADLHAMLRKEQVRMILFGGGEVSNEILPFLDFDLIRSRPKIFCSYSDSTTLLDTIYAKTGLVTYYGASPGTFHSLTPYNLDCFQRIFFTGKAGLFLQSRPWEVLYKGRADGILLGGYLVNFALLLGTGVLPCGPEDKFLLFLEDHIRYNKPAAVARYLAHIEQSEFFRHVSGLIFGHYSEPRDPDCTALLRRFAARHKLAAVFCDDFGHGEHNAVLPIGIRATLETEPPQLIFQEPVIQQ